MLHLKLFIEQCNLIHITTCYWFWRYKESTEGNLKLYDIEEKQENVFGESKISPAEETWNWSS